MREASRRLRRRRFAAAEELERLEAAHFLRNQNAKKGERRGGEKGKEKQADTVHGAKCVSMLRAPDERTPAASARGATAKGRGTDRSEETK